ncbi:MAG: hypothetical protein ORN49_01695, partial [Rhodobacteraceae bacterium]|nr:hypothetical protein [Paracoccaceae bacterium]
MQRLSELLKYVDKQAPGIEIAPYFNPALPKSAGYHTLTVDVFDTESLRTYAAKDPHIPADRIPEIETVDLVGDASGLEDLLRSSGQDGEISHIVSSHNFEHLPNPIKFLQGCAAVLKSGGMLSMAVPDCRASFDHFRMPTRLGDWLTAYFADARQPRAETLFDLMSSRAAFLKNGRAETSCNLAMDQAENFTLIGDLQTAYDRFQSEIRAPGPYMDCHCTVMFPESLELMLRDLRHLGLIDLEIVEISPTHGHEFFVHLRKVTTDSHQMETNYALTRERLMRDISRKIGAAPFAARSLFGRYGVRRAKRALQNLFGAFVGQKRIARLRAWNHQRHRLRRIRKAAS